METITAVVLGGRSGVEDEIASVLEAESVSVLMSTPSAVEVAGIARKQLPDIVVLDIATFNIEGIQLIRQLRGSHRELKIIVLTQQDPKHFSARYRRAGATVLLNVSSDVRGLAFILRAIRSGYHYFDYIEAPIKTRERSFANETDLIATLTDSELMVFQGLAAGLSNRQIAEQMSVGSRHISVHKTNIFEKMLLQSVLQLQTLAVRNGLG
ncbi:LuxR C-terminal-related transcriptional regulator [Pseudomonas marginalis]|uniref:LuxR C-terminal-related transcriptional regulator n=1 Tax=Pseudomonas marginalis TaxID=298 RepID=UPI003BA1AA35